MKSLFSQVACLSILLAYLCGTTSAADTTCGYPTKASVTLTRDGTVIRTFRTGIADTPEKHQKGLMECPSLAKGYGLLFIFSDTAVRSFWMYHTTIPLAIVFIGDDRRVISVKRGEPNSVKSLSSERATRYVLEVNWEEGKNILPGDRVTITFD